MAFIGPGRATRPRRIARLIGPAGIVLSVLLLACVSPADGAAQGMPPGDAGDAGRSPEAAAPVEIDGYNLFEVRGRTMEQARGRAAAIASRIRSLARDEKFPVASLRVFDLRDQTNILDDKGVMMSVFDLDARAKGVPRMALAGAIRDRIAQAIENYRTERTREYLLARAWYAGGTTLGLVVVLVAIGWFFRYLNRVLERRYKAKMINVEIRSFHILEAEDLWSALRGAVGAVHVLGVIALLVAYLQYVLALYPWTRPFSRYFLDLILKPLETIGEATLAALPNLVFIVILIFIVRYLLKMTRLFFGAIALGRVKLAGFESEWALPTYKIIRLFAIAFAAVVAYPYIPGSESAAFKGVSIFIGLVLSLGSTSIIGNLIAGYTMTYRRAFRIGDRIRVKDIIGDVVQMRLLETHLRSLKNEEIVVPNTVILSNELVNYSTLAKEQGLILHTGVGIGYDVSWRQVEAMLRLAAERTEGVLRNPPPFVLKSALGDFCVTYELNAYIDDPSAMPELYSRLHENILDVFNEQGIQIMTPAYISDPDEPKTVPPDRWFAPPAATPPGGDETQPDAPRNPAGRPDRPD